MDDTEPTRPLLTARGDWRLTPPDSRDIWEPYAFLVGGPDGWDLFWIEKGTEDPNEDRPSGRDIPWPFDSSDYALAEDFEALGFRVEG